MPETDPEPPSPGREPWDGGWVEEHLGVELATDDPALGRELVGLALRRNPRRAHLVVSHVLGKHVPADPALICAIGRRLGRLVAEVLGQDPVEVRALVLGYAETATSLGHLVADELGADYLHSTRHPARPDEQPLAFEEEHSHASAHRLLPDDEDLVERAEVLVMVDDELTTGRTIANTVRTLQHRRSRLQYVVVTLVDLRDEEAREALAVTAQELNTRIDVVSLLPGRLVEHHEPDPRVAELLVAGPPRSPDGVPGSRDTLETGWPTDVPVGGRHGFLDLHRVGFDQALERLVQRVRDRLGGLVVQGDQLQRIHVLGVEELMYLPLRLAAALRPAPVTFSSTTRSPVLVLDEPGYAVRHGLSFAAHDVSAEPGDRVPRFAYNLSPGLADVLVLVLEAGDDVGRTDALAEQLQRLVGHLLVVRLHRGGVA